MRRLLNIFWISILFTVNSAYCQKDKLYKSLEDALAVNADSVYRLDLSRERLKEVPSEIIQFKNLQYLNLSKNKLTSLPDSFIFEDLRTLDLSKNKLETFPPVLCKNTSIRRLLMGKNDMKIIPECIGEMQDLIVLDIWFNPIDDLPKALTKLRNLRSLDLSGLNFSKEFQKKWNNLLPWVDITFEAACDCN